MSRPVLAVSHVVSRGGKECDFCTLGPIVKAYACRNFMWSGLPIFANEVGGRWTACQACAFLVDGGDWSGLTDRAARAFIRRHQVPRADQDVVRAQLAGIHEGFARHRLDGDVLVVTFR